LTGFISDKIFSPLTLPVTTVAL